MLKTAKIAYILLWFPKSSETFIFREIVNLRHLGLNILVYTLYGSLEKDLSAEMLSFAGKIKRLGVPAIKKITVDISYWCGRRPKTARHLFRTIPFRRWRSLEVAGENIWAFLAGFTLARQFEREGIQHIHAPWANGPATAAWVASKLTNIPFSFTGRAVDIHPPDGALEEKVGACEFVRVNTKANLGYIKNFMTSTDKPIHLTYNGYPITDYTASAVKMAAPYRILAVGRFARFKGFPTILKAVSLLRRKGVDVHLTLAGSGWRRVYFQFLCYRFGIFQCVSFPGFVSHDHISGLYQDADLFVMASEIHRTGERDGIPNVLMEALLHRLPVITSDLPQMKEVVQDGISGLLIPPADPSALAQAIVKLVNNRDQALKMAEKGHQVIRSRFDPGRNHRLVAKLFEEVLNDNPGPEVDSVAQQHPCSNRDA